MRDLDKAKNTLKTSNLSLVIVKNGHIIYETNTPGIRGLLTAVDEAGRDIVGSAVADKIVGEAAAQVCAYGHVREVYAVTMSQCGKDVLDENGIRYEYEDLVPHILNMKKTDLCPFEKLVAGSSSPKEAFERLKKATTVTSG